MKKILALVLVLTLCVGVTGAVLAEGGLYGCAVPNATNSFYATCVSGVEQGVAEYDPECSVVVTDCNFDSAKQLDQINDLIQQGCKAIVLIPVNSNAIVPALDACQAAGVPVYVMDTPAAAHEAVISTVTADNYSLGEIAGKALINAIGGKGQIVTITTTGSDAVNQRKQALYDLLKDYPDIQIVQEEIVQNGTTEEAQTIMENLISSHPDMNGVFTTGDVFAIGICAALQANGYAAGEVAVASVDGTSNAIELIKGGYLTATAAQLPAELGKMCVKNAVAYAAGETVEALVALPSSEINSQNYSEFAGF